MNEHQSKELIEAIGALSCHLADISHTLKAINTKLGGIDSNIHGIAVEQEAASQALKSLAANYEFTQIR